MSADWNAEFENFLIDERPVEWMGGGTMKPRAAPQNETRSTVPWYVPDDFVKAAREEAVKDVKPLPSPREVMERVRTQLQQGELNGLLSGDRIKGEASN